jgi:hypothetical protein
MPADSETIRVPTDPTETGQPACTAPAACAIRVEKGHPTEEELAALTLVLLTRAADTPGGEEPPEPPSARWRPPGHGVPRSWRVTPAPVHQPATRERP